MDQEQVLKQIGLTDKEVKVYLACLQLGEASVLQLSKKADIKRPHVYNLVESLSTLGLLSQTQKREKTLYIPENPKRLKQIVKQREEKINQILPSLNALYNVPRGTKPNIKIYEGKMAMMNIYDEMFEKAEEIYFFGVDIVKLQKVLPDTWNSFYQYYGKRKMSVKELLNFGESEMEYIRGHQDENYRIRMIPKHYKFNFYSDNALYEDKLIISSLDHLFSLVIESGDLLKTYRTLFELAWESAVEIK